MTADWPDIVNRLVGTPFLWAGREPGGLDCWGVVREACRLAGKPDLPNWLVDTPDEAAPAMTAVAADHFERTESPTPGDVVALSAGSHIHHVGVLTPFGVLHTTRKLGCCVMDESTLRRFGYNRIEYYRWVG